MKRFNGVQRSMTLALLLCLGSACTPTGMPTDNANDNQNANDNGNVNADDNDNDNQDDDAAFGEVSGSFSAAAGLDLERGAFELDVPPDAAPSNATITMRVLTEAELEASGLPRGNGFEHGVSFGPGGTTFAAPVEVRVELAAATVLETLAVLRYDEQTRTWGDSGIAAIVQSDGAIARFELSGFSDYDVWNPPLPPGDVPIGDGEIVAGLGLFEGQPFNVFPGYTHTTAALNYSDFGDVFGLSLVNLDLENPQTGDPITLAAGLHATEVRRLEEGVIVGLVTPVGGLGGPSFYAGEPIVLEKPVVGVMYLRKTSDQWKVDVYCHYEGGLIFGQAVGDLQ